jgi:YjbE family integral membrane protein
MNWIAFGVAVLQIAWINVLLSGDNAVVIALASRSLPARQRRQAMFFGAGAAILLRILIAFIVSYVLDLPLLKVVGGALLLWIAVKLILGDDDSHDDIAAPDGLWHAVRIIVVADVVMSLDNVLAVAAAAGGHYELFIFGLVLSIPLVIVGSQLIVAAIERLPILVWVGGALLGWVAGEMIVGDSILHRLLVSPSSAAQTGAANTDAWLSYAAGTLGAVLVIAVTLLFRRREDAKS